MENQERKMKCDELKAYKADVTIPVYGTIADAEVYLKDKVDEAVAELKEENKKSSCTFSDDCLRVRRLKRENRRLRRLLWRAIALFCARSCEYFNGIMSHCLMGQEDLYHRCEKKKNKYLNAMYKCKAKAEEYK